MYLNETITDKEKMLKPNFMTELAITPAQLEQADRLEVWSSSFNDPGPDFSEFRLMAGQERLAAFRQGGY